MPVEFAAGKASPETTAIGRLCVEPVDVTLHLPGDAGHSPATGTRAGPVPGFLRGEV